MLQDPSFLIIPRIGQCSAIFAQRLCATHRLVSGSLYLHVIVSLSGYVSNSLYMCVCT